MTKCAILLFYATIAGSFYGLLAESPGSQTKLENIEEQLRALRMGQERTERQLEALLQKLSRTSMALTKTGNFSKFEQIGSSFYYIESKKLVSWRDANNTCVSLGAHLASISSQEELSLIMQKIPRDRIYWLDIYDFDRVGVYISATTGTYATFVKWGRNYQNTEYPGCVFLQKGLMVDTGCSSHVHFICEAEI